MIGDDSVGERESQACSLHLSGEESVEDNSDCCCTVAYCSAVYCDTVLRYYQILYCTDHV